MIGEQIGSPPASASFGKKKHAKTPKIILMTPQFKNKIYANLNKKGKRKTIQMKKKSENKNSGHGNNYNLKLKLSLTTQNCPLESQFHADKCHDG